MTDETIAGARADSTLVVRPAMADDAAALAALAFRTSGLPDSERGDFSPARKREEIERDDVTTLIALESGHPVGYLQLRAGVAPDCVPGARPMQLWRIYVDAAFHGRGVARELLSAASVAMAAQDVDMVWLGVQPDNTRAQRFYEKSGFKRAGRTRCHGGSEDLVFTCRRSDLLAS